MTHRLALLAVPLVVACGGRPGPTGNGGSDG